MVCSDKGDADHEELLVKFQHFLQLYKLSTSQVTRQCLSCVQLQGRVYELCYSSTSILELDVGVSSVTVLL